MIEELHKSFLAHQNPTDVRMTTENDAGEDIHYEQTEAQEKLVNQIYNHYNEMITTQILRYINVDKLKQIYDANDRENITGNSRLSLD